MKNPRVMALLKTLHYKDHAVSPSESGLRESAPGTSLRTFQSTSGTLKKSQLKMKKAANPTVGTCSFEALFHAHSVW